MKKKNIEFDKKIGWKISTFRKNNKISIKDLAKKLEISHQQLKKYEAGENQVSSSKLWKISLILEIKIEDFFN